MGIDNLEKKENDRYWEIDAIRGIAVIMMVVSNFMFDLFFFTPLPISIGGFWGIFARVTAGTFLFIAGLSLTLRHARINQERKGRNYYRFAWRGLVLFALGGGISIVTWFVDGKQYVRFGILHLLGLTTLLCYPFLGRKWASLLAAAIAIGLGWAISGVTVEHPWFVWFGVAYPDFHSVDYTPFFPWSGLVFLGMFSGQHLYPAGKRLISLPSLGPGQTLRYIALLGRNSLFIYLVHQPILIGMLMIIMQFA